MIVKLISILAVLGIVKVHAAVIPPNTTPSPLKLDCHRGADRCSWAAVVTPKTECGAEKFVDDYVICPAHTADLMSELSTRVKNKKVPVVLTPQHIEVMLRYYARNLDFTGAAVLDLADRDALEKNMASKVTKEVASAFLAHPAAVADYLDLFTGDAIANAPDTIALINAMPGTTPLEGSRLAKVISKIAGATAGAKWIKDNGQALVTKIKGAGANINLLDIAPEAWKAITEIPDVCKDITDEMLSTLLRSSKHAQVLKSACLENIASAAPLTHSCHVGLRNLPAEVLKSAPPMAPACFLYLSEAQVTVLDEAKEADSRCVGFPLEKQQIMANCSNMRKDCFENALSTAAATAISDGWSYLPKDILTFTNKENYQQLQKDDIVHIPASHKAPIFATTEGCEHIPKHIMDYHNEGVEISKACFKHLNEYNQVSALISAKVDPTILSDVEAATVSKWDDGDYKGLAVLNRAMDRPDIALIIENLNPTACASLETPEELKGAVAIQLYGSKECFDEMKLVVGNIRLSDMQELEENARKKINMNSVIESMDDSNYRNMEAKTFLALQDSSNICEVMKRDHLNMLPSSVLEVINGSCLAKLLEQGEEIERSVLASIPTTSFTKLEGRHCGAIKGNMTPQQFGATSSEVADLEKHFATTWTSSDVTAIKPPDMKYVLASAWKAAPLEAYAGFTAQNFPAVPPANMHVMTLEKLGKVPAEVRATLTVDQAKELAPTALKAFDGITLPEPVRKVIDAALAAQKAKTEVPAPPPKV